MAVNLVRSNYAYKCPVERIAAYFASIVLKYSNFAEVQAIDFSFGGRRHLKLLSDLGYGTYGPDVTPNAVDTAYNNFGKDFIARERLTIGNILEHPLNSETFLIWCCLQGESGLVDMKE